MVLFVNMIIYFPICHLYRSGNAGSVCCFLVPLLLAPFFEALPLSCPTLPYFRPAVPTLQLQTDNRSIQLYRYGIQPRTPLHCSFILWQSKAISLYSQHLYVNAFLPAKIRQIGSLSLLPRNCFIFLFTDCLCKTHLL